MRWKFVWAGALAFVASRSSPADACTCMPDATLRVFPTHLDSASPTTHAWVWVNRSWLSYRMCPRDEDPTAPSPRDVPQCARKPKLILRRAFATIVDDADVPVAARITRVDSGNRSLFDIAPASPLVSGARYEVWWDDEDQPKRSMVIGTFKVQSAGDKTPPVWTAPTSARFLKPSKPNKKIVDMCGTPSRLLTIETSFANDDQTGNRLFYALTFTSGATMPDVLFPSRQLLDTNGPNDRGERFVENIALAQQASADDSEGCYEHLVQFPKGSTLHASIRAIDFSGNSTAAFEFDAKLRGVHSSSEIHQRPLLRLSRKRRRSSCSFASPGRTYRTRQCTLA